eukprot:1153303-Pelagomonas_calceolata.AAC.4
MHKPAHGREVLCCQAEVEQDGCLSGGRARYSTLDCYVQLYFWQCVMFPCYNDMFFPSFEKGVQHVHTVQNSRPMTAMDAQWVRVWGVQQATLYFWLYGGCAMAAHGCSHLNVDSSERCVLASKLSVPSQNAPLPSSRASKLAKMQQNA